MVTFFATLVVGAVAGFMLEKQFGQGMTRWYRVQKMRARVARRMGESPFQVWKSEE